ncbi:protein dispatched [Pectinophora gossypiella]|uniref:protein dispatched n=1 Tax=Pectinophora gossypiella TaxID=13191 RepID=UPI00214E2148|nr:protein dispatched [Pectinophora gossypiella]
MLSAYARFIVRHSYLVLFVIGVISTVLTVIPFVCHELPSFSDPLVGFETRGTTLAHRFIAWENLIDETRPSRSLAVNPQEIEDQKRMNRTYYNKTRPDRPRSGHGHKKKMRKKKKKVNNSTGVEKTWYDSTESNTSSNHVHWGFGKNVSFEDEDTSIIRDHIKKQWKQLKDMQREPDEPHQSFPGSCGAPLADYAHLVVSTSDNTSLLTYENVQKMCQLQMQLEAIGEDDYYRLCQRSSNSDLCCPIWSVPNYIALISGKDSCTNLTRNDVKSLIEILTKCAGYFHNFTLMASCELGRCKVPLFCSQYDAVYNLLFYMIDSEAFSPPAMSQSYVKNVMMFLPLPASSTILPYYNKLQSSNLSYENLVIPAIEFGLKNTLFDLWVIQDTWLIALGGLFVFLCVWIYTKSLLLTLLLFTAITYSLGIAYFLYVYVFNLEFFPFMNLLVIVVVIGIGADDAFLYMKVWKMVSKQLIRDNVINQDNGLTDIKNVSSAGETILIQILEETLKHSVVAIFVTTLTTAVAFFASYVSYIPAINCFSVFAGTAVLVNFLLMISWLPASVFIVDVKLCRSKKNILEALHKIANEISEDIRVILNTFIIACVTKLHIVFVIILGAIGIGSIIVVFDAPGLQLPDSKQFQLFQTSHPFEQYDIYYRDNFLFERLGKNLGTGSKMPVRWIWGVEAIDNGNHMDPASTGHLVFDDTFSISDPDSQAWLLDFCRKIKFQPFYQQTLGPLLPNCFIETFKVFMSRRCIDNIDKINRTPCCETSRFPYKKEVFNFCIIKAMESMYQTPRELFMPGVAGPKFLRSASPPVVAAIVIEYESVVPYSMSYRAMNKFFLHVENWTQQELQSAPPGMKGGWFISDFQFYDLQRTLASGTVMALVLSASLGFVVLIPATLSFVVSICALSAMIFSSTVTIAILVMSDWKLNVLESVAISTSAGLAVDFSLHYALSYTNASGAKSARVKYALTASAGPTAAAALTTSFAGIFLLRSNLLPYSQIGTFLALIMSVSWVYATFFLCSLLHIFGRKLSKDKVPTEERKSVSRVSSICSGVPNLESHELEHLADSNRTNITHSHSPSSVSATTVVLHDDYEHSHTKLENKTSIGNDIGNNTNNND